MGVIGGVRGNLIGLGRFRSVGALGHAGIGPLGLLSRLLGVRNSRHPVVVTVGGNVSPLLGLPLIVKYDCGDHGWAIFRVNGGHGVLRSLGSLPVAAALFRGYGILILYLGGVL